MEENRDNQQSQQETQQPEPAQKKMLMPGQEHEDELDFMGAALFGLIRKGYGWINHYFFPRKVK